MVVLFTQFILDRKQHSHLYSLTHIALLRDSLPYWNTSVPCPLLTFSHLNLFPYNPSYVSPKVPEHTLADRPWLALANLINNVRKVK